MTRRLRRPATRARDTLAAFNLEVAFKVSLNARDYNPSIQVPA
jgi:hypothetical protein